MSAAFHVHEEQACALTSDAAGCGQSGAKQALGPDCSAVGCLEISGAVVELRLPAASRLVILRYTFGEQAWVGWASEGFGAKLLGQSSENHGFGSSE